MDSIWFRTYWKCVFLYPLCVLELVYCLKFSTWHLCTSSRSFSDQRNLSDPPVKHHAVATVSQFLALLLDCHEWFFSCQKSYDTRLVSYIFENLLIFFVVNWNDVLFLHFELPFSWAFFLEMRSTSHVEERMCLRRWFRTFKVLSVSCKFLRSRTLPFRLFLCYSFSFRHFIFWTILKLRLMIIFQTPN